MKLAIYLSVALTLLAVSLYFIIPKIKQRRLEKFVRYTGNMYSNIITNITRQLSENEDYIAAVILYTPTHCYPLFKFQLVTYERDTGKVNITGGQDENMYKFDSFLKFFFIVRTENNMYKLRMNYKEWSGDIDSVLQLLVFWVKCLNMVRTTDHVFVKIVSEAPFAKDQKPIKISAYCIKFRASDMAAFYDINMTCSVPFNIEFLNKYDFLQFYEFLEKFAEYQTRAEIDLIDDDKVIPPSDESAENILLPVEHIPIYVITKNNGRIIHNTLYAYNREAWSHVEVYGLYNWISNEGRVLCKYYDIGFPVARLMKMEDEKSDVYTY